MYTMFFDMHSGGDCKEDWGCIIVNLPEDAAIEWFEDEFKHNPFDIACDCCGENYSIYEYKTKEDVMRCILFDKSDHKFFYV